MQFFKHITSRFDGPIGYVSGVTDLVVSQTGQAIVYSASGQQGGILGRDMTQDLAVAVTQASVQADVRHAEAGLQFLTLQGVTYLVSFGDNLGLTAHSVTNGGLNLSAGLNLGVATTGSVLAFDSLSLGAAGDLIFTSDLQSSGINIWLRSSSGTVTAVQTVLPQGACAGYDVLDLKVIQRSDGNYLVTISAACNSITVFKIGVDHHATLSDALDPNQGLWLMAPSQLETVQFAGHDYILLGASGSSTITVLELTAAGKLKPTDQVSDDLNTRFQGITELQAIHVGDRVFIVAGGADDGLTLFTLLPNGQLLHLETIADSNDIALQNISGLALALVDGKIDVFVTGASETGISQFQIDPGILAPLQVATAAGGTLIGANTGDMLQGGAGNDSLYGGAGNDILIDSAGPDAFYGGAGADTFVFCNDKATDTIFGFEQSLDRLDLSAVGPIYSKDAITFFALAGGIELRLLGKRILIYSLNGTAINPALFSDEALFGPAHVLAFTPPTPTPIPTPTPTPTPTPILTPQAPPLTPSAPDLITTGALGLSITGSPAANQHFGGALRDIIIGLGGADSIFGGAASDTIFGGAGNDIIFSGIGDDSVQGGDDNDIIGGGDGHDALYGGNGDDEVSGGDGNDFFDGGNGADTLGGGNGDDTIFGGSDNDLLYGFNGNDWLYGGADDDLCLGGDGNDLLDGGEGADTLGGGRGGDSIYGGLNDDTLYGFIGDDRLYGGGGADLLYCGDGNDLADGGDDGDMLGCGSGNDTLYGGAGNDTLFAFTGNDAIFGGDGSDLIYCGDGNDLVDGNEGRDTIYGGTGDDTLYGGAGNDVLYGGSGHDQLAGGAGADTFVFWVQPDTHHLITDFTAEDRLKFISFGSVAAIQAHMQQSGSDVIFNDHGVEIILADVTLALVLQSVLI